VLQSELLEITEQNTKTSNDITYEIQRAVGGYRPSSKIQALLKHVKKNLENNSKTVVFSQFTSFLDLIQQALTHEGLGFTRLDGSLMQAARERVLKEFSESPETNILLISLKAGGVGLNLTCANQVIMMVKIIVKKKVVVSILILLFRILGGILQSKRRPLIVSIAWDNKRMLLSHDSSCVTRSRNAF
jgi:hypothetical protein